MSNPNEEKSDVEKAREAIDADRNARVARAAERIQNVLDEERCKVVAQPQINAEGRIVGVVHIVAV
jgi:hypothetical protein